MANKTEPASPPRLAVSEDVPATPPSLKTRKRMLNYLSTPEQNHDLPFSPGMKRTNSGMVKSPKADAMSPYSAANLLKTPKNGDYDSEEGDTPRRSKLLKTPQYFSSGKRLFTDDPSPSKKELGEISSQLKSRLSLAFGSLQQREKSGVSPVKLDFAEISHTLTRESPTRALFSRSPPASAPVQSRANVNLQTLQASPTITSNRRGSAEMTLHRSPIITSDTAFSLPLPDEELSAHNALLAAFSRAKDRRKSHSSEKRRPSLAHALGDTFYTGPKPAALGALPMALKLPPINVRLPEAPANSEQEAIYSLMSLSSPQASKMGAIPPVEASNALSRSSSVAMPVLPPISGLMRRVDDDETDVEDATASDSE